MQTTVTEIGLPAYALEELQAAVVHLEDLEIFVGQRSRMHPGPGWATALAMIRRDLADVKAEIGRRGADPMPRASRVVRGR